MEYQLSIGTISGTGLNTIYNTAQAIAITKSVISNPLASGNLPVAWVEFQPFSDNIVSWDEQYYIYATTTQIQGGATIMMKSQTDTPVLDGWVYTFDKGQFSASQTGVLGVFTVVNNYNGPITGFGLAQRATINNVSVFVPLNEVPVAYNERMTLTPQEHVSVFLSSYINNGTIISQVASNALSVNLTSQSPAANIGFDDKSNTFYLKPPQKITAYQHALRLAAQ